MGRGGGLDPSGDTSAERFQADYYSGSNPVTKRGRRIEYVARISVDLP